MDTEKNTEKLTGLGTNQEKTLEKQEIASKNNKSSQTKSFMQDSFKKIGYALLFLLIGALITVLVLYLPTQTGLKAAQAEVDRLQPIETEYLTLVEEHEIVRARSSVYKTLSDTSMLHVALVNNDPNRIDQYIRYVEEDLKNLTVPNFPDLPSSLTSQFAKVTTSAASNHPKAIEELQDFQNDLLLVTDNLE
ncbi:MAG: hypothetical protein Q7J15_02275 [Candidatus Desulfaltia sp.]|nr:hypothetical protein [Candidatus Desulfaltia sp.]